MTTRTSSRTVVFSQPFVVAGLDGTQPAGAYVVDTDEELLDAVSFPVWRRRATAIRLRPNPGLTLRAVVDPAALDAALSHDAASSGSAALGESARRQTHRGNMKIFRDAARPANPRRPAADRSTGAPSDA